MYSSAAVATFPIAMVPPGRRQGQPQGRRDAFDPLLLKSESGVALRQFADPMYMRAMNEDPSLALGPCVTCRWAIGDGERFECNRETLELRTLGSGCENWEREPGTDC